MIAVQRDVGQVRRRHPQRVSFLTVRVGWIGIGVGLLYDPVKDRPDGFEIIFDSPPDLYHSVPRSSIMDSITFRFRSRAMSSAVAPSWSLIDGSAPWSKR